MKNFPLNLFWNRIPYRWELLILFSMTFFLHQTDRAIFGVLLIPIQTELVLSDDQIGLTGTILFAVLALMMPIAGYVGDRFSKKMIVALSLICWSLSTMLTGLAQGLIGLIIMRSVMTAFFESFYGPSAYPMIAAQHQKTRTVALSIHQASFYFGVMTSGFLAGSIAEWFGWRHAFLFFGGAGILLGIVLLFRIKPASQDSSEQKDNEFDGKGKRSVQSNDSGKPIPLEKTDHPVYKDNSRKFSFFQIIFLLSKNRTFLLLTLGFTAIVCVNNAYLVWASAFASQKFGLSLVSAGGQAMFYHHLAAFLGILLGGVLTDKKIGKFPKFRLWFQMGAMFLGFPAILLFGLTNSSAIFWGSATLFGLFRGLYETNTHAAIFDVVPPAFRSTAIAYMTMIAFLIGSLSPLGLGLLQNSYGKESGLSFGFAVLSLSYLLGALAVGIAAFWTFQKDRYIES